MSREIKFRIWDKVCDRFFNNDYNYPVIITNDGKIGILVDDLNFEEFKKDDLENIIISEYTGLKDKNEKEIYEGDILKLRNNHGIGVVKYYDEWGAFVVEYIKSKPLTVLGMSYYKEDIEVIGNIYENPELLGE